MDEEKVVEAAVIEEATEEEKEEVQLVPEKFTVHVDVVAGGDEPLNRTCGHCRFAVTTVRGTAFNTCALFNEDLKFVYVEPMGYGIGRCKLCAKAAEANKNGGTLHLQNTSW